MRFEAYLIVATTSSLGHQCFSMFFSREDVIAEVRALARRSAIYALDVWYAERENGATRTTKIDYADLFPVVSGNDWLELT